MTAKKVAGLIASAAAPKTTSPTSKCMREPSDVLPASSSIASDARLLGTKAGTGSAATALSTPPSSSSEWTSASSNASAAIALRPSSSPHCTRLPPFRQVRTFLQILNAPTVVHRLHPPIDSNRLFMVIKRFKLGEDGSVVADKTAPASSRWWHPAATDGFNAAFPSVYASLATLGCPSRSGTLRAGCDPNLHPS